MLPLLALAAMAATPGPSHPRLPSANGLGVVVFSTDPGSGRAVLDRFSDRLYQQPSPEAAPVRDLLHDAYFGLREGDGSGTWLTEGTATYRPGTNEVEIDRSRGSLVITESVFAPMNLDVPGWVQILSVRNDGDAETAPLSLFALQNLHLGEEDGSGAGNLGEIIRWQDGALLEWGDRTGLGLASLPLIPPSRVGCEEVYWHLLDGRDLSEGCDSAGDDRVGAFQWDIGPLEPGEEVEIGILHGFSSGWTAEASVAGLRSWQSDREPAAILAEARAGWQAFAEDLVPPEGSFSEEERAVWLQALVFLKMGQVREEGPAHGQIPASLPASAPVGDFHHEWNITWVRDGAYAIRALSLAGLHEEARAALAFMVQPGKSGQYTAQLGVPDYALSVCRYYGDGTEWSDDDGTGPNIELDNFGLYLWAFAEEVRASGDLDFARAHETALFEGIADVLVQTIDPSTGLLMADSSIWERHWNGHQKHFTYSSLWAVRGLLEAAWLAEQLGENERATTYRDAAESIRLAIEERLVDADGVLAGNLEELSTGAGYLDLAAVDAFNAGVLDPRGEIARASLDRWQSDLEVPGGDGGLMRNDDGDLYDRQEWIWADLRTASALRRACREEEAALLEDRVLQAALGNSLVIPELLDPETAEFAGPAPMMGFGSGLWVLGLHERAEAAAACAEPVDSGEVADSAEPADSGSPTEGSPADRAGADGCGCSQGSRSPAWVLPLLALGLLRRRLRASRGSPTPPPA